MNLQSTDETKTMTPLIRAKLNFINKANDSLTFSISKSRNLPAVFNRVQYQSKQVSKLADSKSFLPIIEKHHNGHTFYSITGSPRQRSIKKNLEIGKLYDISYDIFKMKDRDIYLVKFKTMSEYIPPRVEMEKVSW